jgi:eukaryotic-like serine/threonine-protein kinase
LERRRALAVDYAKEAAKALAKADEPDADVEQERTNAVRKLRYALALDPSNAENIRVLAQIITTPPRVLPTEIWDELKGQEQQLVRTGARYSVIASLMWFLFLPIVLWMGVRQPYQAVLVLGPAGLAALVSGLSTRFPHIPKWVQLTTIGLTIAGGAATSTMYGPLVLVPTLLATFTIVLQAHPSRTMRLATWTMGCIALTIVSLVELAQPASYFSVNGAIEIVPRMHELPRTQSIILLLGASLAMTIVPCLFIGRIRAALNVAQRQILVQAWQFRRFGEDLISTARTTPQP